MTRCSAVVRRILLLGCLLGAAGGCRDLPTDPHALQQMAGGIQWSAVEVPQQLPSLDTWLPYLDRSTPEGSAAAARVQELQATARRARATGRLTLAAALEREAVRVAVQSLGRAPEPGVLQQSLFALDLWADRVRAQLAPDPATELGASLAAVTAAHDAGRAALEAGDTAGAILQIASGAEQVREHGPDAVALRVLARAEAQMEALPERSPAVERALHLIRSSREELVAGSPSRALRRALYALQLAEGNQLRMPPREESEPCPRQGC